MVDRPFLVGPRVAVGAHLVQLPIDVLGSPARGSLEGHVFEEVTHSTIGLRFVT